MAASNRTTPIMLLCVALVAQAAQDFPELMNVMFDICGAQKFDLTPSSPCQFRLFGVALAWQECGQAYLTNMEGFKECLDGCISEATCDAICEKPVQNSSTEHCHSECNMVLSCVQQSLTKATGQVSAESFVRDCFTGHGQAAKVQAHLAVASAALPQTRPLRELLSQLKVAAHHRVTPGAVAAEGKCACDTTGTVRGVNTSQGGCRRHGKESQARSDWYCYIEGSMECPGAMPSEEFSGLYWLGCAGPFDYFPMLYPAQCELRKFGFGPQDQPMKVPSEPKGHGDIVYGKLEPVKPRFEEQVESWIQRTLSVAVPLPQEWHAAHANVFLKPRKTPPESGPPLPEALDTPLWWEFAQDTLSHEPTPRAKRPPKPAHARQNGDFWPTTADWIR